MKKKDDKKQVKKRDRRHRLVHGLATLVICMGFLLPMAETFPFFPIDPEPPKGHLFSFTWGP